MEKIFQKIILFGLVVYIISATSSTSGQAIGVIIGIIGFIPLLFIKKDEIKQVPFNLPILCFFLTLILSTILSEEPGNGLKTINSLIRRIGLYYLVIFGVKELKTLNRLIYLLIISASILAIYVFLQYSFGFSLFNITFHGEEKSIYGNRAIGEAVGMILPVALCVFIFSKSFYKRLFFGFSILTLSALLLLTTTRGAYLHVIIATIALGIIKYKKALFFIPVFIILTFLFPMTKGRIIKTLDLDYPNNAYRICMWKEGLETIKKYPLFGIGPGCFKAKFNGDVSVHCYNNLLNIAAEGGLISLFVYILLLSSIFCYLFKNLNNDPLKIGILASLIGWFFYGMVDLTYMGRLGYLFWFLVGCFVVLKRNEG
ncbi:TPA: hypothetical protein DCX16_03835 [bacterium]|nr:hypothetical protein [bacterium]